MYVVCKLSILRVVFVGTYVATIEIEVLRKNFVLLSFPTNFSTQYLLLILFATPQQFPTYTYYESPVSHSFYLEMSV